MRRLTKQQDRENILPNNKPKPAPKFSLQRQTSVKDGTERIRTKSQSDGMKHSASEASIPRGYYQFVNTVTLVFLFNVY